MLESGLIGWVDRLSESGWIWRSRMDIQNNILEMFWEGVVMRVKGVVVTLIGGVGAGLGWVNMRGWLLLLLVGRVL